MVKLRGIAGSANGRQPDSESGNLGPTPSPAATLYTMLKFGQNKI